MKDFNTDIFETGDDFAPAPQAPVQVSAQELEAVVGKMVAKKVKKLKKKHRQKEDELEQEIKKLKKKTKGKKAKKNKKKGSLDDLLMKAAHVSIESGLPELFKSMSAKSKRDSKSGIGGGRDD